MNPFQFGSQVGETYNKGLTEAQDRNLIEDLLARSQDNTANIDDILRASMGISDPQKRSAVKEALTAKNKQRIEQTKGQEVNNALNSNNPLQYIANSSVLSTKEKQEAVNLIENLQLGGVPLGIGNNQPEMANIEDSVTTLTIPRKANGAPDFQQMDVDQASQFIGHKAFGKKAEARINQINEQNKQQYEAAKPYNDFNTKRLIATGDTQGKEFDLKAATDALENPDSTADRLASVLGFDFALSGKGNIVNSSMKNLLLDDISGMGARANQFLEKMFRDSLINMGSNDEAKKAVGLFLLRKQNLVNAENEIRNQVTDEWEEQGKVFDRKAEQEVQKRLKEERNNLNDQLYNDALGLRVSQGKDKEFNFRKVEPGTPISPEVWQGLTARFLDEKAIKEAIKLGYSLDNIEQVKALDSSIKLNKKTPLTQQDLKKRLFG